MWERHDADLAAAEAGDTRKIWNGEICEVCGEYIREGDEVACDGCYYHIECLENLSTRELLKAFGLCVKEVED